MEQSLALKKQRNTLPRLARLEQGTKLKDATANEIESLINYLLPLLGVKTAENDKEHFIKKMIALGDFMRTGLSKYTLEEVKEAFLMALNGTLDVDLYQALDGVILGRVIKAFEKHKTMKLEHYKRMISTQNEELIEVDPVKAKIEYLENYLYPAYNNYLKTGKFSCHGWKVLLDLMVNNGYCKYTKSVIQEIKKEAIEKTTKEVADKRYNDPMNKKLLELTRKFTEGNIQKEDWEKKGFEIAVMKQLEMFKEMEMNIKEIIK